MKYSNRFDLYYDICRLKIGQSIISPLSYAIYTYFYSVWAYFNGKAWFFCEIKLGRLDKIHGDQWTGEIVYER